KRLLLFLKKHMIHYYITKKLSRIGGSELNCWKTINVNKEMGVGRIYFVSFFIGLLTFMFLFVSFSFYHHHASQNFNWFLPFRIFLISLLTIHSVTIILLCIYLQMKSGV